MSQPARLWVIPPHELLNLSVTHARDLVVDCFYEVQAHTFESAKRRVGSATLDPDSIRATVTAGVRVAFKEVGGTFDSPTVETLEKVTHVLARKADAWGTPKEVVAHHLSQLATVVAALKAHPR